MWLAQALSIILRRFTEGCHSFLDSDDSEDGKWWLARHLAFSACKKDSVCKDERATGFVYNNMCASMSLMVAALIQGEWSAEAHVAWNVSSSVHVPPLMNVK